jgi:hypothetical protein
MHGPGYPNEIERVGCIANKPNGDQHDEDGDYGTTGHFGFLIVRKGLADGQASSLMGGSQAGEDRPDGQDQCPDDDGLK